jgi:putative ABC transport system permease protein
MPSGGVKRIKHPRRRQVQAPAPEQATGPESIFVRRLFTAMRALSSAGRSCPTLVDNLLANQLWPHGEAVGQKLNVENGNFLRDVAVVVGVVKHVHYHSLTNPVRPQVFLPYPMAVRANMAFTIRAKASPRSLVPEIRQEIAKLDKDLPVANIRPLNDYVSDARRQTGFITSLCGLLGAIALLLSCIGIYGVTSGAVTRRTKEIGLRMALGAQGQAILLMVLRASMPPVILGGLAGFALSLGVTPLLSSLLFQVQPLDPVVLASVWVFLCLVGLFAAGLPAQRVIRGNPINALRYE